jgi:predicted house-cleaning noncanonical NTP pyrophosphatase (MazG superfamily)
LTLLPTKVNILNMNRLEISLNKIAENILHIDEASLTSLWDKYKNKVEQFSNSSEWEKAVIIFSIINTVRAKNAIFNEKLLNNKAHKKNGAAGKTSRQTLFKTG